MCIQFGEIVVYLRRHRFDIYLDNLIKLVSITRITSSCTYQIPAR
jgi:hypothetical protein